MRVFEVDVRAVVLGAGGFLGVHVVDALRAAGVEPICTRRPGRTRPGLRRRGVTVVEADLDDRPSLDRALAGAEVVVHAAGHYPRTSLDRDGTLALGRRQTLGVLDAAASAGARRLVYVSSTATVAPSPHGSSDESCVFPSAPGIGVYHDLKWEMEALVLAETRMAVAVACPSACLGPEDLRLGTTSILVAAARGRDPAHPDGLVSLVDVRDAAEGIARLALRRSPPRRVLLSALDVRLQSLLVALSRRYGAPPPSPPLRAADAIAWADEAERSGRAALPRELVDLVIHGRPLDTRLAEATLGLAWRPLGDTLDAFDAWARRFRLVPPALELASP